MWSRKDLPDIVNLVTGQPIESRTILEHTVALLNSQGGTLCFKPSSADQSGDALYKMLSEAIRPDVGDRIRVETDAIGRSLLRISPGQRRPYYIGEEGMRPTGVFVRDERQTVPAGAFTILALNQATHGQPYEALRSIRQNLTFQDAAAVAAQYGIAPEDMDMVEWGIRNSVDGEFSNLGLILSDQCPHRIEMIGIKDRQSREMMSMREVRGSVLRQYALVAQFLNRAGYDGVSAECYPRDVLRTALVSSMIQRDYAIEGSLFLDFAPSGVDFTMPGELLTSLIPSEVTEEQVRNPGLARIMEQLHIIGHHVPRLHDLIRAYEDDGSGLHPAIDITKGSVRVYMPATRCILRARDNSPAGKGDENEPNCAG